MFVLTIRKSVVILFVRGGDTLQERFRELRKALGLSQDDFGRKLGVTRGVITNIELGKVPPKDLFVSLVCDTFGVNRTWIETGEGEMFNDLGPDAAFERLCTEIAASDDELLKRAMRAYWDLSDDRKKMVWDFIDQIAGK